MRTSTEYEAFGPWIYPVRTRADLPRLYADAGIDPAAHRLVLKVPRNIERRNATADMHLYDYLVAVNDEELTLLVRHDDRYDTVRVPVDRITAIEDSVSMLDGRLTVHTTTGPVFIAYNGADLPPIAGLIALLRERYLPPRDSTAVFPAPAPELNLGSADIGLVTAYREVTAAEPGLRLISASLRQVIGRTRSLRPLTLHASIVLADDREIQLIHRRDRITRGNDKVHSTARTILPRARIVNVDVRHHETLRQVNMLTVNGIDIAVHPGAETEALTELFAGGGQLPAAGGQLPAAR